MDDNWFNTTTQDPECRVELLRSVADTIDEDMSPADADWFLEEIAVQLPVAHRPRCTGRLAAWLGWTPVYQAESLWCGMTLDYVERDGRFLVLAVRSTPPKRRGRAKVRIGLPNVEFRVVSGSHSGPNVSCEEAKMPSQDEEDAFWANP